MSKRKRSNKKISGFGALKKESQSKSIQNIRNNQLKENEAMSCIQKGNINEAEIDKLINNWYIDYLYKPILRRS